ncbi:hypothetical protein TcBrA4_0032010 [Trypanosoma cruzi]|nr:hypothetical protein TcBrA4_0032010 [Trypanosoma cruzi]
MVHGGLPTKYEKCRLVLRNVYGRPPIPLRISAWCVFWASGVPYLGWWRNGGGVGGHFERAVQSICEPSGNRVIKNGGVDQSIWSLLHVWSVTRDTNVDCRFPHTYGLLSLDYNTTPSFSHRVPGPLGPRRCYHFPGGLNEVGKNAYTAEPHNVGDWLRYSP